MNKIASGLKTLFLVHFVVGLFFGLVYLLIPAAWGTLVGWPVTDTTALRLAGAAMIGFAAGSWFAYNASSWDQVKIVVQMELVWPTLGALALLWGLLFEHLPASAWLNFLILAAFAVAFYIYYARQETGMARVVSAAKPVVKAAAKAAPKAAPRKRRR